MRSDREYRESGNSDSHSRWHHAAGVVWDGFEHRTELALLEFTELKRRLLLAALYGAMAASALLVAGVAAVLAVAAAYWDGPHRVTAIVVCLVVLLLLSGAGGFATWWIFSRTEMFASTRSQLRKDRKCLHQILSPGAS